MKNKAIITTALLYTDTLYTGGFQTFTAACSETAEPVENGSSSKAETQKPKN